MGLAKGMAQDSRGLGLVCNWSHRPRITLAGTRKLGWQLGPAWLGGAQMVDTSLGGAGRLGLAQQLAVDVAQWLGHFLFD